MSNYIKVKKSFTLPEAMITVALLAIVFTMVIQTYTSSSAFVITNGQVIEMQSKARHALEWVAKDIRESTTYISPTFINAADQSFDIIVIDEYDKPSKTINYKFATDSFGFKLLRNNIPILTHINSLKLQSSGHGYQLTIEVLSQGRLNSISQLSLSQNVRSRND